MKHRYSFITGNSRLTILILVVFMGLLWLPSFIPGYNSGYVFAADPMPLFGILEDIFEGYRSGSTVFAFILFMSTAFLVDYLNTRFILVNERTYLPAWFFVIITGLYPGIFSLNPVLPAALLIVILLHFLFTVYKAAPNCYRFFEAGIILGTAGLFYAPVVYFILFIWISAFLLRPFYWREWLYPLLGVMAVFTLAWGYYYVVEGDALIFLNLLGKNLEPAGIKSIPDINIIAGSVYLMLMIVFSSFFMLKVFQFRKVYARDFFHVFFWLFLLSLLFFFLIAGGNYGMLYITAIPSAYIITNYFIHGKKTTWNGILLLLGFLVVILSALNRVFIWL